MGYSSGRCWRARITDADFKAAGAAPGTADRSEADADLCFQVKEPIAGPTPAAQACSRSCIWPRHVLADALLDSGIHVNCPPLRTVRPPTAHYLRAPDRRSRPESTRRRLRKTPLMQPRGRGVLIRAGMPGVRCRVDRRRHRRLLTRLTPANSMGACVTVQTSASTNFAARRRFCRPDHTRYSAYELEEVPSKTCHDLGDWGRPGARRQGT